MTYELEVKDLYEAGFSPEEILLCKRRFRESGFTNWADWCRAYIALNSTTPADDDGLQLDGNLIIKALASQKKPARKRFQLGSYKSKGK